MYCYDDEAPLCCWGGCTRAAITIVYNDDATESVPVCGDHRRLAHYNLDTYGKIKLGKSLQTSKENRPSGNVVRKKEQNVPEPNDWEKEGARRADAAATPIEPQETKAPDMIVPDVPTKRKGV